MNLIRLFTGADLIMGKPLKLKAHFIRSFVLISAFVCASVSAEGQTPKTSPSKSDEASKGLSVKDLDKPFTQLSFEKVRVMAVTPDIAPEKSAVKPAASPGATVQAEQPQNQDQTYSATSVGSSFSFGMYLAPPSSSFGTLVRAMQDQVEQRSQSRDADARQTSVDKMLGFVGTRPLHLGPVNLKLSLGTGSVRTDALDLYDDQLLEKPEFVKHDEISP
jgi:hypothetical protein